MPRPLFSVRFPAALVEALDHWAQDRQWSRSDLVEKIISATTAADRDEILNTPVPGAATDKLNLRLNPETRTHLTELAGDLAPAEFLRRTVAHVLGDTADENVGQDRPASAQHARGGAIPGCEAHVALIRLLALALLAALAALVWVLLRLRHGPSDPYQPSDPLPPSPEPGPRGQLGNGTEPGGSV